MKIYLTFDYELFFGDHPGSVEKCMLEPTRDLFELAEGKDVHYTFFVDVGYLIASSRYAELENERTHVEEQIKEMIDRGHDVQLHIHPHWQKAEYVNGSWEMNTKGAYKISDFTQAEIDEIFGSYKNYLEALIGRKVCAFRAGGWCIQPFEVFKEVFEKYDLKIDSSVIPGDFMLTDEYALDFRFAPEKESYRFSNDVCSEDAEGAFTEMTIASMRYSPLFFWQLYILGRLFPDRHKMIGDGRFLDQGGRKKRKLKNYTVNHISTDGYFAKKLKAGLDKMINMGMQHMVVIGHPKGNTNYSIEKLNDFISSEHTNHQFTTFHKEFCE